MRKLLIFLLSALTATATPAAEPAVQKPTKDVAPAKAGKTVAATTPAAQGSTKGVAPAKAGKTVAKAKSHKKHASKRQKKVAAKSHRHISHKARSQPVAAVTPPAGNSAPKLDPTITPTQPIEAQETPSTTNLGLLSAAVLIVDQKTGKALYSKNADMQTPIASITKLMTSLVVLEAGQSLTEEITVSDADVDHLKHTTSRLPVGATLTRGELMHLALIASENRAAAALARSYPGGTSACIKAMNRKAVELGMTSTHYVDGTGLNSENQSTAADLVKLVNVASVNPTIHQITSTGEYGIDLPGRQMVRVHQHGKTRRVARAVERRVAFHNTNALTRNPDWDIGLSKTGFINEAGHCLVMQTRIADRKVIMVLLDSVGKYSRIGDANRVRHWLESIGSEG
jgi:D-alanyl-D-alanine endopeptidase (penicillin-binding protein 7)